MNATTYCFRVNAFNQPVIRPTALKLYEDNGNDTDVLSLSNQNRNRDRKRE